MAWSADDEHRTRVLSRSRAVVRLRHPGAVYGPAALVLMVATGLAAMLFVAAGLPGVDAATASALMLPAGAATLTSALVVGGRLRGGEESDLGAMIVRVGLIWAFFGAAWPLLQIASSTLVDAGGQGFGHLSSVLRAAAIQILAGASAGGVGGLVGGAAAACLCTERRL